MAQELPERLQTEHLPQSGGWIGNNCETEIIPQQIPHAGSKLQFKVDLLAECKFIVKAEWNTLSDLAESMNRRKFALSLICYPHRGVPQFARNCPWYVHICAHYDLDRCPMYSNGNAMQ